MIARKYSTTLFVILIVLVPVTVYGILSWYGSRYQKLPVMGEANHRIGDFRMTNQKGEIITRNTWKNKIIVVNFFFTHCPVVCPKMTGNLKILQQELNEKERPEINSFTVDPERDSTRRLEFYAAQFHIGKNWNLLTGDKTDIYRLARKSFLVTATDGDGGPNDFIHSEQVVLLDKQQRIRGFYDGTNKAEIRQLARDIRKLESE